MWPFKKGPNKTQECLDDLRSFRDVGESFNYMGVEMMVENHWEPAIDPMFGPILRIQAVYKDNEGNLRREHFYRKDLEILRKQNHD